MMTLRTGKNKRAFTLIELILVMTVLVIMVSVTFPVLRGFFGGRDLESEAGRFYELTHYGKSRAVSEGIPMVLWIDPKKGTYGLEAESGYLDRDEQAVEFEVNEKLSLEVPASATSAKFALTPEQQARRRVALLNKNPEIRFSPDGSIDILSPQSVGIHYGKEHALWINQSDDRLNYAVEDQPPYRNR